MIIFEKEYIIVAMSPDSELSKEKVNCVETLQLMANAKNEVGSWLY